MLKEIARYNSKGFRTLVEMSTIESASRLGSHRFITRSLNRDIQNTYTLREEIEEGEEPEMQHIGDRQAKRSKDADPLSLDGHAGELG